MEILQFLLSYFLKDKGVEKLAPLFELFKNNSFDIKKVLQNLKPETLAPLIESFMNFQTKKSPPVKDGDFYGLNPISDIADKEIVYTLNKYFS